MGLSKLRGVSRSNSDLSGSIIVQPASQETAIHGTNTIEKDGNLLPIVSGKVTSTLRKTVNDNKP
jgi:hypothetical protein